MIPLCCEHWLLGRALEKETKAEGCDGASLAGAAHGSVWSGAGSTKCSLVLKFGFSLVCCLDAVFLHLYFFCFLVIVCSSPWTHGPLLVIPGPFSPPTNPVPGLLWVQDLKADFRWLNSYLSWFISWLPALDKYFSSILSYCQILNQIMAVHKDIQLLETVKCLVRTMYKSCGDLVFCLLQSPAEWCRELQRKGTCVIFPS